MIDSVRIFKDSDVILQKTFEAFPDLIFLLSKDGTFLYFKGNEKNSLIPPEKFLGKKIIEIAPKNTAKMLFTIN